MIGIDDNLFMHRFTGPDGPGGAKEASNAKLSVRPLEENDTMTAAWVAPGLLMTASNEACGPPPPPPPRTKWTRRVPHPVLIGHAASLTPC